MLLLLLVVVDGGVTYHEFMSWPIMSSSLVLW